MSRFYLPTTFVVRHTNWYTVPQLPRDHSTRLDDMRNNDGLQVSILHAVVS